MAPTFTAATVAWQQSKHPSSSPSAGGVVAQARPVAPLFAAEKASLSRVAAAHSANERKSPGLLSICKSLFAGGVAGGVSRTAVAPLERLKILQQVAGNTTKAYNGVYGGLAHIWRTEGIKGMFTGNGANCIRIVPNSASKFLAYEYLEGNILAHLRETDPDAELGPLTRLCAGAGAGIFAMSATYPLDMVRGRLTVQVVGRGG